MKYYLRKLEGKNVYGLINTPIECIIVSEVISMLIRDMRKQLGDTQSEFAARYNIPFRTVQN